MNVVGDLFAKARCSCAGGEIGACDEKGRGYLMPFMDAEADGSSGNQMARCDGHRQG